MATCLCHQQFAKSAKILGIDLKGIKNPDRINEVKIDMNDRILNTFSDHSYILTKPVGNCDIVSESLFLAYKAIPKKNRKLLLATTRKGWVLNQLYDLGAFDDVIEDIDKTCESESPNLVHLTQVIYYGTRFEAGRDLMSQLVNFIDLSANANQLINTVYSPSFRKENHLWLSRWANFLKMQANMGPDAASRAHHLADWFIERGKNPAFRKNIQHLIDQNCWNLFKKKKPIHL
mgnify:CR=1 FL=1